MTHRDEGMRWLLPQIKPNCTNIACRNLKRQGKFVTATGPLSLGYIFLALDVARGLWHNVSSTYKITHLLSLGKKPAIAPPDLVSMPLLRC